MNCVLSFISIIQKKKKNVTKEEEKKHVFLANYILFQSKKTLLQLYHIISSYKIDILDYFNRVL